MKIFDLESEISLSRYRKNLFVFITLFIITLSIYSNTFSASWHFDDVPNITGNPNLHLKELSWQNIKRTFFANQFEPEQLYRPSACLSFALNYYFGQDNVLGFHIVNISIHFLSAVFLFLFIYHTLTLPVVSARYGPNSYFVALLATTLWVINPIQTQAITFIVQRMASMAGMFYIISMYLYLRGRMASQNPVKAFFFSLCALSTILAFFSKENALMIPVSLFFYDFLLIQGVSREKVKKNLKILLAVTVMTLSIAIVFFAFSEITFSSLFSLYSKRPFTLWERLITQPRAIIFYISLILYPMSTRLSLNHDIVISNSLFDPPTTILAIILIIGVVIGAISIAKREPLISFSVFFFFLNHIPESTILPLELIFEHRNYIPSMLFFVPIAIGLLKAISYFSYKRSMQVIISLSIILVIIMEGHSTFMRNFTWKNEESLWIDCIDKYPNLYRPQHNLANYYHDQNKIKKAIDEYEKALKLKAANTKDEKAITYFNLGVIYFHKKEFKKAKDYYLQAMNIDPCLPGVHNNLAVILAATTKSYEEVYGELNRAAKCKPASVRTHSNLGILLVKSGRIDEGIGEMKKALEIEPNNIPTLERLGYAYIRKGMLGTASIYFKRTLNQMIPMNISALLYLTEIYTLSGHKENAQNSLSQFVDFAHYTDLGSLLNKLYGEESLLTISPDMNIVLPLLSKAYEEKAMSLRKNIDFCLDKL
jgi:Tfp pilus assembly protein PilF